jgi:hypothetical protein
LSILRAKDGSLGVLAKEIADLQEKHDRADQELDQMIEQITMDEKF